MAQIRYVRGDATSPQGKGVKLICHICNDIGGWGKGFVLAISNRWKQPEADYRAWHQTGHNGGFAPGEVQFVQVEPYVYVANMIAQRGIKRGSAGPPIRYEALDDCLAKVAIKAIDLQASIHMPRIGCGLAGGKWEIVAPMIEKHLVEQGLSVVVYDFD